jgi:hypothetical protein
VWSSERKSRIGVNVNRVVIFVTEYLPRVVDESIRRALTTVGGVLIEGARAVGKTTTGLHHAASSVRLDSDPNLSTLASLEPASVLKGDTRRLIDEWQLAPELWNAARHEIDERGTPGRFLFSGTVELFEDHGFERVRQVGKHPWILSRTV